MSLLCSLVRLPSRRRSYSTADEGISGLSEESRTDLPPPASGTAAPPDQVPFPQQQQQQQQHHSGSSQASAMRDTTSPSLANSQSSGSGSGWSSRWKRHSSAATPNTTLRSSVPASTQKGFPRANSSRFSSFRNSGSPSLTGQEAPQYALVGGKTGQMLSPTSQQQNKGTPASVDLWSPMSHQSNSSTSSHLFSPSFVGRNRFASVDTTATSATGASSPGAPAKQLPSSDSHHYGHGSSSSSALAKVIHPLQFKKRHTPPPKTSPSTRNLAAEPLTWRDPWASHQQKPSRTYLQQQQQQSPTAVQEGQSFVAALGSQPITYSEAERPSSSSSKRHSGPYQPLFGPTSAFARPLHEEHQLSTSDEALTSPSPQPEASTSQTQLQPAPSMVRQRTTTAHAAQSRSSKPARTDSNKMRRPKSNSFSDLRTAARDADRLRDPDHLPPSPQVPLQYSVKNNTSRCLPTMSARPRLLSNDTVKASNTTLALPRPRQEPSRDSVASTTSTSADSILNKMESFRLEREAWKSGHRYPKKADDPKARRMRQRAQSDASRVPNHHGLMQNTENESGIMDDGSRPRARRLMSMPSGSRRPKLLSSFSNHSPPVPQSCAFVGAPPLSSPNVDSSDASEQPSSSRRPQWLRSNSKAGKKAQTDGLSFCDSRDEDFEVVNTDDPFRSPSPPTNGLSVMVRSPQRPRLLSEMLPQFSFQHTRDSKELSLDPATVRDRRPRRSSHSGMIMDDQASRYSVTPSGHLVGYGMAVGDASNEGIQAYTRQNSAEAEELGGAGDGMRESEDSTLRRTRKGESYRIPSRSPPMPPSAFQDTSYADQSQDQVVFAGIDAQRASSASGEPLTITLDPARSGAAPEAEHSRVSEGSELQPPSFDRSRTTSGSQNSSVHAAASGSGSSALSDDRHANYADLFFHPPAKSARIAEEGDFRPDSVTSQSSPVAFKSAPDTADSRSSAYYRQSMESGRVTDDSHVTTVDSEPPAKAPALRTIVSEEDVGQSEQQHQSDQPEEGERSMRPGVIRIGSFRQPQRPAVVVEAPRQSFLPDFSIEEQHASPKQTHFAGQRESPESDNDGSGSQRSFINLEEGSPPAQSKPLRPISSQQSFLEDFSPPGSPQDDSSLDQQRASGSQQTPRLAASQGTLQPGHASLNQRDSARLLSAPNEVPSPNMLDLARGSYGASSVSSFDVSSFPHPPDVSTMPQLVPLPSSHPSRPSLRSHDSSITAHGQAFSSEQEHFNAAPPPEIRLRPSFQHSESETTVYTFAPETMDGSRTRSRLNVAEEGERSRSRVNLTSSGDESSAYVTPAEELESVADQQQQEGYFAPGLGITRNPSSPIGRALQQDPAPRGRTWSSSFIDLWRQSLHGDDSLDATKAGGSRRSSGIASRTYSDPASPVLQARGLDSPDEWRRNQ